MIVPWRDACAVGVDFAGEGAGKVGAPVKISRHGQYPARPYGLPHSASAPAVNRRDKFTDPIVTHVGSGEPP
jgi:hypothetical protein